MLLSVLLVLVGLALLVAGAELVVRSGTSLAGSLGISPLVIGLTIVSVGTSAPELAVGVAAALHGNGSLAVGNIAGTNLFNILVVLGLAAVIAPVSLPRLSLKLDLPVMTVSAVVLVLMALDGVLTRLEGALLVAGSIVYTVVLLRMSKLEGQRGEEVEQLKGGRVKAVALLVLGLGVTVGGAEVMVRAAVKLATLLGVSDAVIGLTVVAIGTSAPELAGMLVSSWRGQRDIAVGNVLGSSTYNILFILGVTCLVAPDGITFHGPSLFLDLGLAAGVALLCVPVFLTGRRVSRGEGVLFVSLYVIYLGSLLWLRT